MSTNQSNLTEKKQKAIKLYQKYGKPLETKYKGLYLVISPKGQTVIGKSLGEVLQEANNLFGQGNFLYKIGESTVGNMR